MKRSQKRQAFTLLEVLMVVAMLAIVGGAIITSYGGLEDRAAKGTATHSIAAVTEAFLIYDTSEGALPNNLESLAACTPTGNAYNAGLVDNIATGGSGYAKAGHLGSKIAGKFTLTALTAAQEGALNSAGINTIRYLDLAGNGSGTDNALTIEAVGGVAATVDSIADISIPQHAFSVPRGADKNRGRGFAMTLSGTTAPEVMVWNPGTDGYNNVKVGGNATSVLVGLGLGGESTLVRDGVFVTLQHAPYYGNVGKHEYNHYVALIDVNVSPARLVAVVDSRGDFLDEEFAESTGQKN